MEYEPTRESLRSHPVPAWYDGAKLGIFIHWSVSSIPAFAPRGGIEAILAGEAEQQDSPYSEWYWNSLKLPGSAVERHHRETYGDRPYESFADDYRRGLEQWQPDEWARVFREAGARYAVLVTKHHDGFCLWPSSVAHPDARWRDWHTGRDVVGELAGAVRGQGLRFGAYYSGGLDWTFDDRPLRSLVDVGTGMPGGGYPAYADAQVRELIERVAPDVLWNDISWPDRRQGLLELVAHYYDAVPDGVINDRWLHRTWLVPVVRWPPVKRLAEWLVARAIRRRGGFGAPPPPLVYDYRTPEYATFPDIQERKWECVRGIDKSFGYNRASRPEDFLSHEDLLHSFVDIVSKNGNLLLNVGPRGEDARIPEIQLERLRWLGDFLGDCGEAIYETRPWKRAEGTTREGVPVRFTSKGGELYATLLGTPDTRSVTLVDVPVADPGRVRQLGRSEAPSAIREGNGDLRIEVASGWAERPAHGLALGPEGDPG
ncbi:MAG: alpha-L-fucosidase [Myxococcota bacterium]